MFTRSANDVSGALGASGSAVGSTVGARRTGNGTAAVPVIAATVAGGAVVTAFGGASVWSHAA